MFDPYCATCSRRVLVGFRRLLTLDNTLEGIVLRFACYCGNEAVLTTGRLASAPARRPSPATAGQHVATPPRA